MLPSFLSPNPTPAGPPLGRPAGSCQSLRRWLSPRFSGWQAQSPQAACPLQVLSPGQPRKRTATARHMESRPGGGKGKAKSILSKQLRSQGLSPGLPSTAPAPCPHGNGAATAEWPGSRAPRQPAHRRPHLLALLARRSRAPGQRLSPLRPTPVTQHPTSQRPLISRPRSCKLGTRSEPGARS